MRKSLAAALVATGMGALIAGCAGMSLKAPDPKRIACEQAAEKIRTETVKPCTDKGGAAGVCDAAGKVAYDKSLDDCMKR